MLGNQLVQELSANPNTPAARDCLVLQESSREVQVVWDSIQTLLAEIDGLEAQLAAQGNHPLAQGVFAPVAMDSVSGRQDWARTKNPHHSN